MSGRFTGMFQLFFDFSFIQLKVKNIEREKERERENAVRNKFFEHQNLRHIQRSQKGIEPKSRKLIL